MESFDTWKLVSLSPLPLAALLTLCLALVFGVVFACFGVRHEATRRRRFLLWTLRGLAGICAA